MLREIFVASDIGKFLKMTSSRQGRCVLMPRYLRPLAPPPTILNKQEPGQQQAEAVAWSVLKNPQFLMKTENKTL